MKKWISLFLLLPFGISAQNMPMELLVNTDNSSDVVLHIEQGRVYDIVTKGKDPLCFYNANTGRLG